MSLPAKSNAASCPAGEILINLLYCVVRRTTDGGEGMRSKGIKNLHLEVMNNQPCKLTIDLCTYVKLDVYNSKSIRHQPGQVNPLVFPKLAFIASFQESLGSLCHHCCSCSCCCYYHHRSRLLHVQYLHSCVVFFYTQLLCVIFAHKTRNRSISCLFVGPSSMSPCPGSLPAAECLKPTNSKWHRTNGGGMV